MKKIIINLLALVMAINIFLPVLAFENDNTMLEIYVSEKGNDNGDGTKNNPVKTLEKAREIVRKNNKNMTGDIVVNVEAGTYFMTDTFVLTEADSGTNGYKVIWRGEDMNTYLSGGRKISGFKQHDDDIYKAVLPEVFDGRKITGLYINGKEANRAGGRILYKSEGMASDMENKSGWLTPGKQLDGIVKPDEMQMRYAWSWITNTTNVSGISKDFEGNPILIASNIASGLPNPVLYTYFLYNDYSFIQEPNDFYYDSSERTVYYKKPQNIDLEEAEVIAPYLDCVMKIQGSNNLSKVQNIEVTGFSFSHCEDNAAAQGGVSNEQSIVFTYTKPVDNYPSAIVQTASVWVNNADNITMHGNRFSLSERVGLGLYEGVTNSKIDGNIFTELASSGISVGLPSHRWVKDAEYLKTNVAYNKETIVSNNNTKGNSWKLVDDYSNSWFHVQAGSNIAPYVQIDLGETYNLDSIEIDKGSNFGLPIGEFEIWGSNQENFLEYKMIAESTAEKNPFVYSDSTCWSADLTGNKFRYIRLVGTNKKEFVLRDIRVYSADEEAYSTSICQYNKISNNIFTDVANYYYTAAGMTLFYVADTDVFHNELYGTPYTGISIGWGWASSLDKTMINNRINYNYINGAMQRSEDGGSIYSLGSQKNEEIRGNYCLNQRADHGAIYPDNGATDILITQNVVENVPKAYFPYSPDQDNLRVEDNYATTKLSTLGARNSYIKNTKLFVKGYMPEEARKIADFAGLEQGYEELREKAGADRNTTEYKNNYPTAFEMCNRAYGMNTGGGKVLSEYVEEAKTALQIAVNSGLITEEYSGIVTELKQAIDNASVFTERPELRANAFNEDDYLAQQTFIVTAEFREILQRFIDSGVFTDDNYDMIVQNMGVEKEDDVIQPETAAEAEIYTQEEFSTDEIFSNQKYIRDYEKVVSADDTVIKISDQGGCYTKYAFGDTLIKTNIQIDNKTSYPGLVLRSNIGKYYLSTDDCYLIIFKESVIELQRFNKGKSKMLDGNIPISTFEFGKPNNVEVSAVNEAGGVRISCAVNGQEVFNILDKDEEALKEPGFFGFLTPVPVYLRLINEETAFYKDLEGFGWAANAINALYIRQIAKGKDEGIFAPADGVTRAELSKMFVKAMGSEYNNQKTDFSDLSPDMWYYEPVAILEKLGAYDGICGTEFLANTPVSRKEVCMLIKNIFEANGVFIKNPEQKEEFSDVEDLCEEEKNALAFCTALGIIEGYNGEFNPDTIVTRAEAAVIIKRIIALDYLV